MQCQDLSSHLWRSGQNNISAFSWHLVATDILHGPWCYALSSSVLHVPHHFPFSSRLYVLIQPHHHNSQVAQGLQAQGMAQAELILFWGLKVKQPLCSSTFHHFMPYLPKQKLRNMLQINRKLNWKLSFRGIWISQKFGQHPEYFLEKKRRKEFWK